MTGSNRIRLSAWASVSAGVASLDTALDLWQKTFGFSCEQLRVGEDPELARLWGIEPQDIVRQALLHTPGIASGGLHLVQFRNPDPPVRRGAQVFDLCPKNLDVYVDDLPRRLAELKRQGHVFRNDNYSEVSAPDGTTFREIHLPAHDDINVVLLEVLGQEHPFTPQGFAGIGPLITIVKDAQAEHRFFSEAFALQQLTHNLLSGPEVEKMVGLPPGSALDVSIWGERGQHFGQLELIQYRGVAGADLYPSARAKALGVLQVNYHCRQLADLTGQLTRAGAAFTQHPEVVTLAGTGPVVSVRSPAGLRIDLFLENGSG